MVQIFCCSSLLQASLTAQDGSEGKVCLHWAVESAHPAAPNIVQLLCKKQNNLIEAKVSPLTDYRSLGAMFPL